MKKIFTLLSVFLMATGINAGGIDYQFNWGTSIEGNVSQAANVIGVKKASDGNYFVSLVWGGTTAAGKTISWGGQNLQDASGADIEGADYSSGNSYTPNLLFAKTDKTTGNPIWKVYTNFGYVNNSNCSFTSTADGGAILLVSVRQSEGADYRLANIVGSDGTVTYLQHTDADKWSYRSVLIKIDADGKVVWTRTINALDETKEGKGASTPFYTYDIVTGTDNRIYVSGRMCTTVYFPGKNGRLVAKDAIYNDGWTGDSQTSCGNGFIAEFSEDGYINNVMTFAGEDYKYTQIQQMVIDGTTMYAAGVAKKSSTGIMPTLSVIDLKDNSLKVYKEYAVAANSGGKQNFRVYSLSLADGSLYMTGNLAGSMTDNNITLTAVGTAATLDGFIARLDTEGNLLAAKNYGTLNTGIMGTAEVNGGIVALAYQMTGAGAVALAYDKALSSELSRTTLMTSGTTATASAPLFDGENIVVLARGAKAASAFYGTTEVKPALKQSFGVLLGSWKVTGNVSSGINAVSADFSNGSETYSINGIRMTDRRNTGNGILISNGKKTIVRK